MIPSLCPKRTINTLFYAVKPWIPRRLQIALRRSIVRRKRSSCAHIWPIDPCSGTPPAGWPGWPHGKKFALVLTHDVEWAHGQDRCEHLATLEQRLGFRSSFNFVPERYHVSPDLRRFLTSHGFEVGVHGLKHDGKLYQSREIFRTRAARINAYIAQWNAVGFRSPSMHHNLEWLHDLHILYDASTFDTDPFEPQTDGVRTIFPFWVHNHTNGKGYVELPYTLPQDFTLFILLQEKSIDVWIKKLAWIAEQGGMALVNTHPDYMHFDGGKLGLEEYPADYYAALLAHVQDTYAGQYWAALPAQLARFVQEQTKSPTTEPMIQWPA
jgi:hypothetical protein